ncbi:MAG: hypothetical protein IT521_13920 [Burkholderiales bacterium]|nr:hypothetical protein [Burkholderiales bacterium]
MNATIGAPAVVDAGRGAAWWSEAWRILTSNFFTWIGIMIVYMIISVAINAIPFVGAIGHLLLTPVFIGGFMLGCAAIERGEPLRVAHLFEGFQGARFVPLMSIGAINCAIIVAAFALMVAAVMGSLPWPELLRMDVNPHSFEELAGSARAMAGTALLATLLLVVFVAVVAMANWFAPALVTLRGATAVEAMKLSFVSCLRNWLPFLVYGLIGVAIIIASMLLFVGVMLLLGAGALIGGGDGGWGALLGMFVLLFAIMALELLVLGPLTFASIYAGFRDSFDAERGQADIPAHR